MHVDIQSDILELKRPGLDDGAEHLLHRVALALIVPFGRPDAELKNLGVDLGQSGLDAPDWVQLRDEIDLGENTTDLCKRLGDLTRQLFMIERDLGRLSPESKPLS